MTITSRNPIGANTWIWVSPLTDERLAALAPRVREWGFDLIELPVEHPGDWDPARAAELLGELGLGASVCAVMGEDRSLVADDPAVITTTQGYLRQCLEIAKTVGSAVLGGPIYATTGQAWLMDAAEREATVRRLVASLRPVAEYAGEIEVRLAIEPLNRYETSLVTTAAEAVEIVERLGSPACGILLDTFHMNIEEQDLAAAIRTAGTHLAHFHACGNDRGAPGDDHLDWSGMASALRDVAFTGPVVIESFTAENKTIATSASIWRPLARSQDAIATDGLAFLRELLAGN